MGILKNGKIIREDITKNLMEKFKTSCIEDLFVAIIFDKDKLHRNTVIHTIITNVSISCIP